MSEIRSPATPAREELAALSDTIWRTETTDFGGYSGRDAHAVADHLWAEGYRKPRTVNSAAELGALPVGSVIRSEDVTALKARNGAWLWDDGNYWEPLAGREVRVLFTPWDAG